MEGKHKALACSKWKQTKHNVCQEMLILVLQYLLNDCVIVEMSVTFTRTKKNKFRVELFYLNLKYWCDSNCKTNYKYTEFQYFQ